MIIWLTGNSGAGKTTTAYNFKKLVYHDIVILDGDEMRSSISLGAGFSKGERRAHNHRVARLAKVLHEQDLIVFVSVIAPFEDVRKELEEIIPDVKWVYIKRDLPVRGERPYEPPANPYFTIDIDRNTKEQCVRLLEDMLNEKGFKEHYGMVCKSDSFLEISLCPALRDVQMSGNLKPVIEMFEEVLKKLIAYFTEKSSHYHVEFLQFSLHLATSQEALNNNHH